MTALHPSSCNIVLHGAISPKKETYSAAATTTTVHAQDATYAPLIAQHPEPSTRASDSINLSTKNAPTPAEMATL